METKLADLVEAVASGLGERHWQLATAESCTGGWIAKVLTDRAGSSSWFDRGFVTYSNQSKQDMLGVLPRTLSEYGAVSRETVLEMAGGALANSSAQLSVAVSGIAGPGGGTAEKPVGTVWLAWGSPDGVEAVCEHFPGDREDVRRLTVMRALQGLLDRL